ncbi:MAG: hypothetical protein ACOYL6_06015 [Bacteriovoracaceae bacterium]
MKNLEGEEKMSGNLSYRSINSFGELIVKPVHKQWKGYPFLSYEARLEFLKSIANFEMTAACGTKAIKVNIEMEPMEYPNSLFFSPVNPSGLKVSYTCKLKEQ